MPKNCAHVGFTLGLSRQHADTQSWPLHLTAARDMNGSELLGQRGERQYARQDMSGLSGIPEQHDSWHSYGLRQRSVAGAASVVPGRHSCCAHVPAICGRWQHVNAQCDALEHRAIDEPAMATRSLGHWNCAHRMDCVGGICCCTQHALMHACAFVPQRWAFTPGRITVIAGQRIAEHVRPPGGVGMVGRTQHAEAHACSVGPHGIAPAFGRITVDVGHLIAAHRVTGVGAGV